MSLNMCWRSKVINFFALLCVLSLMDTLCFVPHRIFGYCVPRTVKGFLRNRCSLLVDAASKCQCVMN